MQAEIGERPDLSGFARGVLALMDRVEYRLCREGDESYEDIARLRHKAFLSYGLMPGEPGGSMKDELDFVPNAKLFGVYVDGGLASTVKLHLVTDDMPQSTAMRVFADRINPRLAAGETFIDPARLCSDPDLKGLGRIMPYVILRLAVMALDYHQATACLSMVREEHLAFYSKVFNSVNTGETRPCPPFVVPVYLYESSRERNMALTLGKYPFFRSSAAEREALFGSDPARHGIVPSARAVLEAA